MIYQKIRDNKYHILLAILIAFLMSPTLLYFVIKPIGLDTESMETLEPSWKLALNYAYINDLNFGKDVIFTYGPLSFLATRVAWGVNRNFIILFDLFCFANYFFLIYFTFKTAKTKIYYLIYVFFLLLCLPLNSYGGYSIILLFISIFWLMLCINNFNKYYLVSPILISALLFFMKFNTSFISIVALYTTLIYFYYLKKINLIHTVTLILSPAILIVIFSKLLNISIFEYVSGGLSLIQGFNDTMHINKASTIVLKTIAVTVYLVTCVILFYENIKVASNLRSYLKRILPYFIMYSVGYFILYKQSFVRADTYHTVDYFSYILILLIASNMLFNNRLGKFNYLLLTIPLILLLFLKNDQGFSFSSIMDRFNKKEYFSQVSKYYTQAETSLLNKNNKLPDDILKLVGDSTVDVFPWNIQMLIENGLNYAPRPVLQSYSVYTKRLQDLNFDYYNSNEAPRYVIFDLDPIDNRYTIFDESKVYMLLEKKYKPAQKFKYMGRSMLLLERTSNNRIVFEKSRKYSLKINDEISLRPGMYYEIKINKTLVGNAISLIDHSPQINIRIDDGQRILDKRSSSGLLRSGIYSSNSVLYVEDFYNSFVSDKVYIKRIEIVTPDTFSYDRDLEITEYSVKTL